MTAARRTAQIFGVGLVAIGVSGFFFTGMSMDADLDTAPRLFGLFPVNVLLNVVYVLFGAWGVAAARQHASARSYAQIAGVAFLGFAALGFVLPELFDLLPIGGVNIGLHVLVGAVLASVGFSARPAPAHHG